MKSHLKDYGDTKHKLNEAHAGSEGNLFVSQESWVFINKCRGHGLKHTKLWVEKYDYLFPLFFKIY